ncbi:transglutaminase domain-containing protein [Mediterraneibacter agrestimuris]|uniref:transglutaminase domain-containing protein n=1 Tax=Mediterraneibacter agrestimuris TaxID=2941333 RepID=UPI00203AEFDA|nr:transglutaminase domain-containing protein [Mediterraneibacter agrestimuris]
MKWSKERLDKTEQQYLQLKEEIPELRQAVYARVENEDEELAFLLKYLYSHMPLSDAVDYPYDMFRSFAEHGIKIRKEVTWKRNQEIPEELFLDYVLFHRVNTESLTFCRDIFAESLWERVKGKKMEEAVLETNYWCAEEATYQTTDERTISAEGVFRGAVGRCGEESVFTVNALRSIGIPARQVYAHRWAHCDDNHAWVEVWCGSEWHFFGACEPEEILDRGWFLNASSRAMMVHSRLFGAQEADGEVIEKNGITAGASQLKRYAKTVMVTVYVKDEAGNAVENAEVSFSLLNYAELVPIAYKRTNQAGKTTLETGKGSLYVSVGDGENFAEQVIDAAKTTDCVLILHKEQKSGCWKEFDMNAPLGQTMHTVKLTDEQKQIGKKKFEAAVAKRLQKVSLFPAEEKGCALHFSRGNSQEILKFLESSVGTKEEKDWILSQLSIKDFRDVKAEILEEHLFCALSYKNDYEKEIFVSYILSPRIFIESLGKYRIKIKSVFSEEEKHVFQKQPELIWEWIQIHIREVNNREYQEIFTTPSGCMEYRMGTLISKKLLFVAIARTFGIPSRLDSITRRMQYWKEGRFFTVQTEERTGKTGKIDIFGADDTHWVYMQNWTIAKKNQDNVWQTLQIGEGYQGNIAIESEPGYYRILTSNRLPNGNQFASKKEFCLKEGEEQQIAISLRAAKLEEMLNQTPLETFFVLDAYEQKVPAEKFVQQGMQLFIWAEVGKEPTEHIFNEMLERQKEFAVFENTINVILRNASDVKDPTFEKTVMALPNIRIYYDHEHENINVLARRMYGDPDKLPLILVVDEEQRGLYAASGYNVGTGDMLLRILKHYSNSSAQDFALAAKSVK